MKNKQGFDKKGSSSSSSRNESNSSFRREKQGATNNGKPDKDKGVQCHECVHTDT